jgi:hypothetical protein
MPASTPNLILQYCAIGLQRKLNLSETQVYPAIAAAYDPGWRDFPLIQVCPGPKKPKGGGGGGQDGGGTLLRAFTIKFAVFYRCKLDRHGDSVTILTESSDGLVDLMERLREVFALTQLATAGGLNALLYEPMTYEGETDVSWVDGERGIVKTEQIWSAPFSVDLPSQTSLNLADVL